MTINKETHKKTYTGMCGAGMEKGQKFSTVVFFAIALYMFCICI